MSALLGEGGIEKAAFSAKTTIVHETLILLLAVNVFLFFCRSKFEEKESV